MTDAPHLGTPPRAERLERFLRDRWSLAKGSELRVSVDPAVGSAAFVVSHGTDLIDVKLTYRRQPEERGERREPWTLVVDGLDALLGQLLEADFDHRSLPRGEGVEFEGAEFRVEVERKSPALDALADALLDGHSAP